MIDFADLDTIPGSTAATVHQSPDDIRKAAHVANGGEASFPCPKCNGTGVFRGYARTFSCFKCKGVGKVSKGVAAAAKGKATRAANVAAAKIAFEAEHPGLIEFLRGATAWSDFAARLVEGFDTYGSLQEKGLAAAQSMRAKCIARQEERKAERSAANAAKSGDVGVDRINALFATATANGLKKPIFRTEHLVIKLAKNHADTLYVTDKRVTDRERGGPAYVGKIVAGKFEARREAMADTLSILCEIASDPMESAVRYGRATGTCCCCGRELTNPASVEAGIGPDCASGWGL